MLTASRIPGLCRMPSLASVQGICSVCTRSGCNGVSGSCPQWPWFTDHKSLFALWLVPEKSAVECAGVVMDDYGSAAEQADSRAEFSGQSSWHSPLRDCHCWRFAARAPPRIAENRQVGECSLYRRRRTGDAVWQSELT